MIYKQNQENENIILQHIVKHPQQALTFFPVIVILKKKKKANN